MNVPDTPRAGRRGQASAARSGAQIDDSGTDANRELLVEERDFLLRSLRDLEAERDAGDIDEHDYDTLRADYTTRAAAVIRALANEGAADDARADAEPAGGDDAGQTSQPRRRFRRRILVVGSVVALAVVSGLLVTEAAGRRGSAGLTGLDVTAASSRLVDCQEMEREGNPDRALECYGEILDSLPGNVATLAFRGWLQIRAFDAEDGLADLDAAIQLDPSATAPYIFRASGRSRTGDAPGAVADLAAFYANDPAEEELALAESFAEVIVDAALDSCIDGEVTGTISAVTVLECYRHILDVEPGNPTASIYLGWLLARTGFAEDAMVHLDRGLDADPDLTAGYVFRAALRAHVGDVDGARADLATFDGYDTPDDQVAAADAVRAAVAAGTDPLGT